MKRNRKFNTQQVCAIRHKYLYQGKSPTTLAKQYGVSPSTIRRIANNQFYSDIPAPEPIPGFYNYVALPDGRIWSTTSKKFIKATDKGNGNAKYYNLKNGNCRMSIKKSEVKRLVWG